MTVSKATADLCLSLLAQVNLGAVTEPEFESKVAQLLKARDELAAVPPDDQPGSS